MREVKVVWKTVDEINFLKGLGRKGYSVVRISRLELLTKYQVASQRRAEWGEIDKKKVNAYLEGQIKKETIIAAAA